MKRQRAQSILLLISVLMMATPAVASSQDEMHAAVDKLVRAAEKRTTLWPWEGPAPEVANVAKYGKAVAPLLVNLLANDPDSFAKGAPEVDWNVQQQVALALCRIYHITEESGHVYMNRASREENASVKRFWVRKVGAQ